MDGILRDVRYAWRAITRKPGFAAVVVLTLGLGIGASTGVLGVIDTVLLRPFDWPADDELVFLWESYQDTESKSLSYLNWTDWRDQNRVFEDLGAYSVWSLTLTGSGAATELSVDLASSELFTVLGLQPLQGRVFSPLDEVAEARVVLLSEGFWSERFGSDPEVIGSTLTLSGESWEVIGVLPDRLDPPLDGADIYAPITTLSPGDRANRGSHPGILAFGRLRPGVDLDAARADMARVTAALAEAYPASNREAGANLVSYRDRYLGASRPILRTLGIASALFLLLICANVASLLVARSSGRRREVAVRSALGASRGRLVRLALIEVGLLSAGGAMVGFGVAAVGLDLAAAFQPGDLPRLDRLSVDLRLLGVALGAGVLAAGLAGVIPAVRLSLTAPGAALSSGRGSAGPQRHLARRGLVIAEVAMATALLVGAGLMTRSVVNLTGQELGLDSENVLVARVPVSQASYPTVADRTGVYRQLLDRVAQLPGVESAAGIDPVPLGTNNRQFTLAGAGIPTIDEDEGLRVDTYMATTGYFTTMGIPLLAGRAFDGRETPEAPSIVIDEQLVQRIWPGERPTAVLGRSLRFRGDDSPPLTIVGVAGHVRHYGFREEGRGQLYLPSTANVWALSVVVRTEGDPRNTVSGLRQSLAEIDPDIPLTQIRTMAELADSQTGEERFLVGGLTLLGAVAVGLALLGLYGVLTFSIVSRTREIGIRMALGAARPTVVRAVVREALTLVTIGVGLGLAASVALGRALGTLLFDVEAVDPMTFALVAVTFLAVGAASSLLPAHRITTIDPAASLRAES